MPHVTHMAHILQIHTLPETNIAHENPHVSLQIPSKRWIFYGYVSFREGMSFYFLDSGDPEMSTFCFKFCKFCLATVSQLLWGFQRTTPLDWAPICVTKSRSCCSLILNKQKCLNNLHFHKCAPKKKTTCTCACATSETCHRRGGIP